MRSAQHRLGNGQATPYSKLARSGPLGGRADGRLGNGMPCHGRLARLMMVAKRQDSYCRKPRDPQCSTALYCTVL